MSKRTMSGLSICLGEYVDDDGYIRCENCDSKTMMVMSSGYWQVDKEAFKEGEETPAEVDDEEFVGEVTGRFCTQCDMLVSLTYNPD